MALGQVVPSSSHPFSPHATWKKTSHPRQHHQSSVAWQKIKWTWNNGDLSLKEEEQKLKQVGTV